MKYFTMDWWRGVQELQFYDPLPEFQAHLAKIRDRIPSDLLALQETISLHDAHVREIKFDAASRKLEIRLDGDDLKGGLRRFYLTYIDVDSFRSTADSKIGLPGPRGYGELGYDEADITDDGQFEHRMLFSNGIEFQIIFGDIELQFEDGA